MNKLNLEAKQRQTLIDGEQMTASVGGSQRVEGSGKKEKVFMDMDNSVVIMGGGVGIQGLNGTGKNTIKIKFKNNNKK